MTSNKPRFQTPHTYVIILGIVLCAWLLTFVVPAGKYTTEEIQYEVGNGETASRVVLQQGSFRYLHPLKEDTLIHNINSLANQPETLADLEVDSEGLNYLLENTSNLSLDSLSEIGLEESELYEMYGDTIYDTSINLNKTAGIWGTDDHYGFGFLNYIFEGLVTGDRYGSAIGIVALLLVVGGSFGIIMKTGAIDAGIYAFVNNAKGFEHLALPLIFFIFSFSGATFGASEQVIPFVMIIAPFCVALGYDSITAVTITFVASQIGNATSWMSPFSIAIAQGIAGLPALSGAGFRIFMWLVITTLACGFLLLYARKIKANPEASPSFHSDAFWDRESKRHHTIYNPD